MLANGNIASNTSVLSVEPVLEDTSSGYGFAPLSVSSANSSAVITTIEADTLASASSRASAATQDFDADGHADILWRDASVGAAALLMLDGPKVQQEIALKPYLQGDQWQIQGVGHFNEDASPDLLWRHRGTGQTLVWLMAGAQPFETVSLPLVSDLDWDVRGVGNFDHHQPNARPDDLLWYNRRTGERVLWFMDGTEKRSSVALLPEREAPGDLLGIGDFDGNGTPDLLWQQDDGTLLFWKMEGTQFLSEAVITVGGNGSAASPGAGGAIATAIASDSDGASVSPNGFATDGWQLNSIADYNQDGKVDILWQRRHEADPVTPAAGQDANAATGGDVEASLSSEVVTPRTPQALMPWEIRLWEIDLLATSPSPVDETAAEADDGSVSNRDDNVDNNGVSGADAQDVPTDADTSALQGSDVVRDVYDSRETVLFSAFLPASYRAPEAVALEQLAQDWPVQLTEDAETGGAEPEKSPEAVPEPGGLGPVLDPGASESPPGESVPEQPGFNIEFDYRFDSQNWFTTERRSALEAAAEVWERLILDEFPTTPAGTQTPFVRHPETAQTYVDTSGQPATLYTTDAPIDDVLILVGTQSLGPTGSLALAAPSGYFNDDPRYTGERFQPWLGSLTVNRDVNWFFDPTPGTDDDIPAGQSDFISTAVHEIGHVLGFSRSIPAFARYVSASGDRFIGPNTLARTNGLGIPLDRDSSHIEDGFELDGSGETALDPVSFLGKRQLPTIADAVIFDDLGYIVDYSQVAENLPENA